MFGSKRALPPTLTQQDRIQQQVWCVSEIPFPDVPPNDPAKVARFFVGREEEFNRARTALARGENVLLRGTWGIGKTAFILSSLYRLKGESSRRRTLECVYVKDFRGGSSAEFYEVLRRALGRSGQTPLWRKVTGWMRPSELKVKIYAVVEATYKPGSGNLTEQLTGIFERAERRNRLLVVAVDDLDKTSQQQGILNTMLRDAINILRDRRCAFLITGRAITKFDDMEISSLGVVNEIIPMKPLSAAELREAAIRQLNLVRKEPLDSTFPFDNDVIESMAAKSFGIPRIFYRLCKKSLDFALLHGHETIGLTQMAACYQHLQDDLSVQMPPDVKRILYYALKRNGFLVSSKYESLEEVLPLVGATTVYDLVPYLDGLVRAEFMLRIETTEGFQYRIAPGTERAAEEGGKI
jgi:Cdc6-like AAA superfamily ATPase